MAELNNAGFTGSGNPQITYKVTYGVRSDGGYGFTITCSLSSSGSFLGTGYGLQAVITCGTYSVTIPLKATTDSWRGSGVKATKTGTLYAGWSTSTRAVTFRVDRTDSLGGTVGIVNTQSGYTIIANQTMTLPTAPTTATLTPSSNFTDTLSISWSGAAAGVNNPIAGYFVVFQTSTNGTSWAPSTEGNYNLPMSTTYGTAECDTSAWAPGTYCRVLIRPYAENAVNGTNQGNLYTSPTIRKKQVTDPTPPAISINKTQGSIQEEVTVSWGRGSDGTNNPITGYSLRLYENSSANNWSGSVVQTWAIGSSVRSRTVDISQYVEGGDYAYFQIGVIDSYDNIIYAPIYSDYVKVNYQPNRPTLIVPAKNNVSTYNAACPVWLQSGTDGDGYNQDYGVEYGSQASMWGSYRQIFKFQGIEDEAITIDSCNTESSPLAINITKLTLPWSGTVAVGDAVKAKDITDLRSVAAVIADYYGLPIPVWTDSTITPGQTVVKALHIIEIQNILKAAASQIDMEFDFTEVQSGDKIKASHINELRQAAEVL